MAQYRKRVRAINAEVQTLLDASSDDEGRVFLNTSSDGADGGLNLADVLEDTSDSNSDGREDDDYGYLEGVVSSSDSGEDNDPIDENISLGEDIAAWATKNKITRTSLGSLLVILKKHGHDEIPKDPRTLLHTPRTVPSAPKCGGQFSYFGLKNGVEHILHKNPTFAANNDSVDLNVNIDGVPLFKSSNTQLWPILCKLHDFDPFLVALYCGDTKPSSVTDYLEEFLEEYNTLNTDGLTHDEKTYTVKISAFVCDAPARAFLKCVKSHSGYSSCERCTIRGSWEKRVVFNSDEIHDSRTDEEFHQQAYEYDGHQLNISPLTRVGFQCVKGFSLDYMHLVCLGVVKRMLTFLKQGPRDCRLSQQQIKLISTNLCTLNGEMPSEFARQPRSLALLERWKATEFRQFLLYTGPIVFKDVLPFRFYKHFLSLTVAISILLDSDEDNRNRYVAYSRDLLLYFVTQCKHLYGSTFTTYNVHSLLHLADDAINHNSSLNDICAFPFENHLQYVKKLISKSQNPIAQCAKRIAEHQASEKNVGKKNMHTRISDKRKDRCLLLRSEDFAFVREKREDGWVCDVVKQENIDSFFIRPCNSNLINIGYITERNLRTRSRRKLIQFKDVKRKAACLSHADGYVLFPLLHDAERE
jgi:hypothetical protein